MFPPLAQVARPRVRVYTFDVVHVDHDQGSTGRYSCPSKLFGRREVEVSGDKKFSANCTRGMEASDDQVRQIQSMLQDQEQAARMRMSGRPRL